MTEEGASAGRNEPAITVATGANMSVPPVYRGSTKKEKKVFMDSYLIYKLPVLSIALWCVICMYELGKPETEITEEEWKAYFLAARRPEVQDHARLTQAMRSLSMDTSLPDAESRVMQLVTDFNAILDTQDMDDFPIDEPKMSVEFLCAALKPQALKQTGLTEVKRTVHKSTKKSVKVFVDWLGARVSAFLIFESAIQQTTVNQVLDAWAKPDSGAEVSVVTPRILQELTEKGQWLRCRDLKQWESIKGITAAPMVIKQEVKLDLRFDTVNGGITLKNLTCWVVSGELPRGMGDILLSEGVMELLGYNAQALLDQAQNLRDVYDMDEAVPTSGVRNVLSYAVASFSHIEATPEEQELQPEEEQRYFPDVDIDQDCEEARTQEWSILEDKLNEASEIKLGRDPPVDMPPLRVTLKPNAIPVRCKARRYPAEHRAFMKKYVKELIDGGLCYRNPHSKWCSPPLIVKKMNPGDFRMTVDVRRVNVQTLRLLWPMPILKVIMDYLTDSELYFLLDFLRATGSFFCLLSVKSCFLS
ncbi:hypothetical protein PHMEG_00029175 [Phytophthora megakarya]|uniref:Reverse transcriptase n=1 Tax=Phytophthora megakarya TaxID=4795 RepID=A0A225V462_9STRA|nr:hypothetical protein PHMEG_00029175 [Phytophthora megakarya]